MAMSLVEDFADHAAHAVCQILGGMHVYVVLKSYTPIRAFVRRGHGYPTAAGFLATDTQLQLDSWLTYSWLLSRPRAKAFLMPLVALASKPAPLGLG